MISLCYESELYNPLTEFIIERSIKNMTVIGFQVYWILRSWMQWKPFRVKFKVICEQILFMSGSARKKLHDQHKVNEFLKEAAHKLLISNVSKRGELGKELLNPKKRTTNLELPEVGRCYQFLTFPHDHTILSNGFASQFCKAIGESNISILIQCTNLKRNLPNYQIQFKYQEEVLQDLFVMKVIQLFDLWWMEKGLDLKMSTVKLVPTDDRIGFGQVVENVESLKNICEKFGTGLSSIDKNCINKFLEVHNKGQAKEYAAENFRRSVAGFCVATYVLGVVEKNYSYYLISEGGRFLHRTFGKEIFGGAKREKVLVAYTREMEIVIDRNNDEYFLNLCYSALTILRKNSHELLNLLGMMIVANLPSLRAVDALDYVRDALNLGGNDADTCQNVVSS